MRNIRCVLLFVLPAVFSITKEDCAKEIKAWPRFREIYNQETTPNVYKDLYDYACSLQSYREKKTRIPKIIHQIWIGGPVPEVFLSLMDSWKRLHPDWEYKLWTDKDIQTFPFINKIAFRKASNYGMKSDIWRYEILFWYGGVYVDIDQEALLPHDIFHHLVDFYLGFFHTNSRPLFGMDLGNGVVGACKGHSFLKRIIAQIKAKTSLIASEYLNGSEVLQVTGPWMILHLLKKNIMQIHKRNRESPFLLLPKPFFYPLPVAKNAMTELPLPESYLRGYVKPFTYGIQYHTSSWIE